jgi:hypothetical protein
MQSSPLKELLTDIAIDPARYEAYLRDPDAAAQAAGLTEESRSALRSADQSAIIERIGKEEGDEAAYRVVGYTGITPPQSPGTMELFTPLR